MPEVGDFYERVEIAYELIAYENETSNYVYGNILYLF
jgi:hypothetical protein